MTNTPKEDITPIAFQSAEEFRARPKYLPALHCSRDDLDRIVGKYSFSEKKQLQCGLNGCNTWHQHGYVIRTKDGWETHCGQDCGHREFGVTFKDVEATYSQAEERKSRKDFLDKIIQDKQALLLEATALYERVSIASNHVQRILNEIRRDRGLDLALSNCLRNGGRIQVEDEDSKRLRNAMGASSSKADLKTIGIIRGGAVVASASTAAKELMFQVIGPLKHLDDEHLNDVPMRVLQDKTKVFSELRQIISRAQQMLQDYEAFVSPANLQTFMLLQESMSKKARNGRTTRILEKLPTLINPSTSSLNS